MKKRILSVLTALLLVISLCVPAMADGTMEYVIDVYDLLTYDEWEELEAMAESVSEEYDCGVYIVIVDDYTEYGYGDVYDVTTDIYNNEDSSFGYGDDRDGIMLLLSMYDRDWAMFVHGDNAEYAFNEYGQEQLEESFLPYLSHDEWYDGFASFIATCEEYLELAENGEPVEEGHFVDILIAIGVACFIAILICLVLLGKMKSVKRKVEAKAYVTPGGFRLDRSFDRYTHTTETRRKIESKSSSSSHSGGGGSGRSGKF